MKIMRLDQHGNLTLAGSFTEIAEYLNNPNNIPAVRLLSGGLESFDITEDPTLDKLMVWTGRGIKIKGELIEGGTL